MISLISDFSTPRRSLTGSGSRSFGLSASVRTFAVAATLCLVTGAVSAQTTAADLEVDWLEEPVAPPPSFDFQKLVAIDMPSFTSLKFGVDPQTISISNDGVVRYVMVATSETGVINAMYEGIRCTTGEVKTYARYNASGWEKVQDATWRSLQAKTPSYHAQAFARQGACDGRARATSAADIVRALTRRY